jgi:hypothetical protein
MEVGSFTLTAVFGDSPNLLFEQNSVPFRGAKVQT